MRIDPVSNGGLYLEFLEKRELLAADLAANLLPYLPQQHNLFDYGGYLTDSSTQSPVTVAENYIRSHASDLGILPADLDNYIITTNYVTKTTGATTLTFEQSFDGLPVDNADFNITVTADGRLVEVAGGFVPDLSQHATGQPPAPVLSAEQAVAAAERGVGIIPSEHTAPIVATGTNTFSALSLSVDPITTSLRYVAIPGNDVSQTWNLTAQMPDGKRWYNLDVDSTTGGLDAAVNYIDFADYQVFNPPTHDPSGSRTIVNDPQIITPTPATVPSPFGWHDTNGVAGPEFTITEGNNANAYTDRNADNLPDAGSQPDGGPNLDFSGALVPLNLTQPPVTYSNAAVVNLFYLTNFSHDVHYLYGFDEAARNFQTNDYGRGGVGGDAVLAEAQDGSGTDNANFATPPDGAPGRMQMFEFNLTTPNRDGDLDAEVVLHEYGHGVSNRLTGNGNGLDALQSGGMGEGWSDWWALMLTQKTSSEPVDGRGTGTYVLGQPPDGQGIREFKYKFDITNQNLETFLDYGVGPSQSVEVHDAGTRWCAALWDINKLFIDKYGFEPNVYNSTSGAGNIRALHLIMNALKIQPLNPSFIQARDAILMADQVLYNGADQLEIWTAFAGRGLGEFASTPSSNSVTLTTSFVVPLLSQVSIGGSVSRLEGNSGTTNFVFPVSFSGEISAPATVLYTTADGSATAGSDYAAQSGTLTFQPNGPSIRTIVIQVFGDTQVESDETFFVRLSNPTNTVLGNVQGVGTILNDDVGASVNDLTIVEGDSGTKNAVFTISVIGSSPLPAQVTYATIDDTAHAGSDYLPVAGILNISGPTSFNVTVPIIGDTLGEPTEDFFLELRDPLNVTLIKNPGICTILDNDPTPALVVNDVQVKTTKQGEIDAVFAVALDRPGGDDVTVQYATADGSAKANTNYLAASGTLDFAPGVTEQLVTVQVLVSGEPLPNETFSLNLFNAVHADILDAQGIGTIIFANPPTGDIIIDDGEAGYSQTCGWTNTSNTLAYHLDYDFHAPGSGQDTATWTFAYHFPGTYQVFARWSAYTNRATNAPYTIYDESTPLATVAVNQQLAPSGDLSNGVTWQSLGTFNFATSVIRVKLSDNANGLVTADAVRIVPVGIQQQAPEMDVAGFGQSIADGATAPIVDDGTDFGKVFAVTGSATHTFTISNTGNADLHLSGNPPVSILGIPGANSEDFTVITQPSAIVAAGASTTFQVMFRPPTIGLSQAIVSIDDDDASEHPYTFEVQGTAIDLGSGQGTITAPSANHNAGLPQDVNGDHLVTSSDVLIVINRLNSQSDSSVKNGAQLATAATRASSSGQTYYYDVNGDGKISPNDALMVINYLLQAGGTLGTSHTAAPATPATMAMPNSSAVQALAAVDQVHGQLGKTAAAALAPSTLSAVASAVASASTSQSSTQTATDPWNTLWSTFRRRS